MKIHQLEIYFYKIRKRNNIKKQEKICLKKENQNKKNEKLRNWATAELTL